MGCVKRLKTSAFLLLALAVASTGAECLYVLSVSPVTGTMLPTDTNFTVEVSFSVPLSVRVSSSLVRPLSQVSVAQWAQILAAAQASTSSTWGPIYLGGEIAITDVPILPLIISASTNTTLQAVFRIPSRFDGNYLWTQPLFRLYTSSDLVDTAAAASLPYTSSTVYTIEVGVDVGQCEPLLKPPTAYCTDHVHTTAGGQATAKAAITGRRLELDTSNETLIVSFDVVATQAGLQHASGMLEALEVIIDGERYQIASVNATTSITLNLGAVYLSAPLTLLDYTVFPAWEKEQRSPGLLVWSDYTGAYASMLVTWAHAKNGTLNYRLIIAFPEFRGSKAELLQHTVDDLETLFAFSTFEFSYPADRSPAWSFSWEAFGGTWTENVPSGFYCPPCSVRRANCRDCVDSYHVMDLQTSRPLEVYSVGPMAGVVYHPEPGISSWTVASIRLAQLEAVAQTLAVLRDPATGQWGTVDVALVGKGCGKLGVDTRSFFWQPDRCEAPINTCASPVDLATILDNNWHGFDVAAATLTLGPSGRALMLEEPALVSDLTGTIQVLLNLSNVVWAEPRLALSDCAVSQERPTLALGTNWSGTLQVKVSNEGPVAAPAVYISVNCSSDVIVPETNEYVAFAENALQPATDGVVVLFVTTTVTATVQPGRTCHIVVRAGRRSRWPATSSEATSCRINLNFFGVAESPADFIPPANVPRLFLGIHWTNTVVAAAGGGLGLAVIAGLVTAVCAVQKKHAAHKKQCTPTPTALELSPSVTIHRVPPAPALPPPRSSQYNSHVDSMHPVPLRTALGSTGSDSRTKPHVHVLYEDPATMDYAIPMQVALTPVPSDVKSLVAPMLSQPCDAGYMEIAQRLADARVVVADTSEFSHYLEIECRAPVSASPPARGFGGTGLDNVRFNA